MSKTAVNNEIVLMRQAVRKSRVSVVRKLIKEAKLLKARKHGNEKVLEKCKRKAKRLIDEIEAAKKIKDDDVSKFGITETRCLQAILNDTGSEPSTRIMARLTFHKFLRERILQFKEKFSSYEEFLGPGRRKMSKLQRKASREARNCTRNIGATMNQSDGEVQLEKVDKDDSEGEADDITDSKNEDGSVDSEVGESMEEDKINDKPPQDVTAKEDPELQSNLRMKTSQPTPQKTKNNVQKNITAATNRSARARKPVPIKVISEEATVKRFTDLMEKKESSEIVQQWINGKNLGKGVLIEKQADSFFMTENGESEYMSIVVPKSEQGEDNDQGDQYHRNHGIKRQKTFHEKNNTFFKKIGQRSNSDYANGFSLNTNESSKNDGRSTERFARTGKDNVKKFQNVKRGFEEKNGAKEEELHPSWQARKKQQEILKQGFQGKKIVFAD